MKRYLTLLTIAVSLILQACATKVDPEDSCGFEQNSLKQRVSWSASVPVTLYIHQNVPQEFRDDIREAAEEWNDTINRDLIIIADQLSQADSNAKRDGQSTIFWLNHWEGGATTEQARTTSFWRGDTIYESDIRINNRDFDFFDSEKEKNLVRKPVHFKSLMVHELGHVLGLAHREDGATVMSSTLSLGEVRSDVDSEVDGLSLECEY